MFNLKKMIFVSVNGSAVFDFFGGTFYLSHVSVLRLSFTL